MISRQSLITDEVEDGLTALDGSLGVCGGTNVFLAMFLGKYVEVNVVYTFVSIFMNENAISSRGNLFA